MLVEESIRSVLSRFSAASVTSRICSGRLSRPASCRLELTELRGDDDLIADRRERFADQLFVRERTVHLRGVEERHTGRPPRGSSRSLCCRPPVRSRTEPHAAEAQRRTSSPLVPNLRFCTISVSLRTQQCLDRSPLIHRAIAVGNLFERQHEIEHLARVDLAIPCQVDQLRQEAAHRGGPPWRWT